MVSRTILSRLRLPFRHIGLYSILGHSYRFLKIGGMLRRDVRNPASTNFQNSTNTREFLAQTRKNTKRILSFRHCRSSGVIQCYLMILRSLLEFRFFTHLRLINHQIFDFSLRFPSAPIFQFGTSKRKLEGYLGGMQS